MHKSDGGFRLLRLFPEELESEIDEQIGVEFGFGELEFGLFDIIVTK